MVLDIGDSAQRSQIFRFEKVWLTGERFRGLVEHVWNSNKVIG